MKTNKILFCVLLSAMWFSPETLRSAAEPRPAKETQQEFDARMAWWNDARFGLFIHWGLYAVPAGEWNGKTNYAEWIRRHAKIPARTYDGFVNQFNPVKFDADAWVQAAKGAGMKYVVITSKHHDGFCLWPSEVTRFDVESTPFKRDILGELTEACRTHGLRMCFYYSIMDWHHPGYPPHEWEDDRSAYCVDMDTYTAHMKAQLKELIGQYDPAVLWFDGEWEEPWTHERGKDLYDYVRSLKPDIIINNRVDKGRTGMKGLTKAGGFRGDFGTPEQEIPHTGLPPGICWESCMTMNNHWGWNRTDQNWKSGPELVRNLIDIASKGGNYLLNVGPKADGTFPQESIERLAFIGQWMGNYGQAVYGTTASPYERPEWGRYTKKPGRLYAHVFDWPKDGRIDIPIQNRKISTVTLMTETQPVRLNMEKSDHGIRIRLPAKAPDPVASVIEIRYSKRK